MIVEQETNLPLEELSTKAQTKEHQFSHIFSGVDKIESAMGFRLPTQRLQDSGRNFNIE